MKQLGLAFVQYVQGYDEQYPGTQYYGNGWSSRIYPYVKSIAVYTCPDDATAVPTGDNAISYGLNDNLVLDGGGGGHDANSVATQAAGGYSSATLNAPASTICLFEVQNSLDTLAANAAPGSITAGEDSDEAGNLADYSTSAVTVETGQYPGGRPASLINAFTAYAANGVHTGGANYLACDGHAKWLRPSNVSSGWDAQAAGNVQTVSGTYGVAAATDAMYLDAAKTQSVGLTMSKL